jgi:hypothetical protein
VVLQHCNCLICACRKSLHKLVENSCKRCVQVNHDIYHDLHIDKHCISQQFVEWRNVVAGMLNGALYYWVSLFCVSFHLLLSLFGGWGCRYVDLILEYNFPSVIRPTIYFSYVQKSLKKLGLDTKKNRLRGIKQEITPSDKVGSQIVCYVFILYFISNSFL